MSAAILTNNGVMHPSEGRNIMIALAASTPTSLDCSAFANDGEMVTIFNSSAGVLGYKFSASSTPDIDIAATSGTQACGRLAANSSSRGYIPVGAPHLHLVNASTSNIYVSVSSVNR